GVRHGEREGIAVPYRGAGFTMTHPPPPFDRPVLPLPRRRNYALRWTIAAIVLTFIIVPAVATRLSDWLWYQDIGFERVFLTKIIAQWVLGLAAGVGGFLVLYVNGRIALRGVPTRNLHIRDANAWAQEGPKVLIERVAVWFVLPVTTLLALILALNSAGNWRDLAQYFYRTLFVDVPSLLLQQRTVLFGASYTDLHVRLPLMRVLAGLLLLAAAALIWYARSGRVLRGAVIAVLTVFLGNIALSEFIPGLYQSLVVQPNELNQEKPQIQHHLTATRQAWGIDAVDRRELTGANALTMKDIDNNPVTVKNVRLWDREPLLQTYGQIQSIRTYYDFVSVDDDRYNINGEE